MSDIKPPIKRDFYAIITNASGDRVLLIEDEDSNLWVLPHWEALKAIHPSVFNSWVIQTLRERYSLETIVIKDYYFQRIFENNEFRATHRVLILQLRGGSTNLGWHGMSEITPQKFANPLHAELIQRWLLENSTGQIPLGRMPWARLGWFEKAEKWVTDFVKAQNWQITAPIEQRKSDVISAQLKVSTSAGNLYLKAVPPYFKDEPVFGQLLEKLLPGEVPQILEVEASKGWILMTDFKGQAVAEFSDFSVWEAAVREYANLQITCIPYVEELLQAGARDRRLKILGGQIEKVLGRDDLWLVGETRGLSQEELDQLHAAIPHLQALCLELAAFGLPETIDSGDFHAHNVAVTAKGFVFYDWSDLSVTHPFLSLNPFRESGEDAKAGPDYWEKLTRAYLEPWQKFLPQAELERALQLADLIGCASQILNYAWIHDNIESEDYQAIDGGFIYFARKLLDSLKNL